VSRNIDLVYGGGSIGLMGLVSQAVHDGGRHVIGYYYYYYDPFSLFLKVFFFIIWSISLLCLLCWSLSPLTHYFFVILLSFAELFPRHSCLERYVWKAFSLFFFLFIIQKGQTLVLYIFLLYPFSIYTIFYLVFMDFHFKLTILASW
jgi:hypothetical protein